MVLAALHRTGGRASTAEIRQLVEGQSALTAQQLAAKHGAGPGAEVHYRLRWALVDLRRKGLIERTGASAWALTARAPSSADRSADGAAGA